MLCTTRDLLAGAEKGLYAVGALNIDTDMRLSFSTALRLGLRAAPDAIDPRKILSPARDAVRRIVMSKMELFSSATA